MKRSTRVLQGATEKRRDETVLCVYSILVTGQWTWKGEDDDEDWDRYCSVDADARHTEEDDGMCQ